MPRRTYTQAYASIRFYDPELDPLTITRLLVLPPDDQYRSGEPRLSRSSKGKVMRGADYQGGMWSMSSRAWVNSSRLQTHLDWLLSQLEPQSQAIRTVLANGTEADFFCFSSGSTAEPPSLPATIRNRAEALGIRIEIDHYQETVEHPTARAAS